MAFRHHCTVASYTTTELPQPAGRLAVLRFTFLKALGRNPGEFRPGNHNSPLRSHTRDQKKDNKRAGGKARAAMPPCYAARSGGRHAMPPMLAELHCRFPAVSLVLSASCVGACLTWGCTPALGVAVATERRDLPVESLWCGSSCGVVRCGFIEGEFMPPLTRFARFRARAHRCARSAPEKWPNREKRTSKTKPAYLNSVLNCYRTSLPRCR